MPNLDQQVNSVEMPWAVSWRSFSGLGSSTTFGPLTTLLSGYPSLPCQLFRETTNRNSRFSGRKLRTAHAQKLFEWYSRKPPPVKLAGKDRTLRKELLTDKADWRRSRPVRTKPKKVPAGWHIVSLPTGGYKLRSNGYDPRAELTRFEWIPEVRDRLRPINRTWSRHSRSLPVDALVNDLVYFHQTGTTDGYGNGCVNTIHSQPTNFSYTNPQNLGSILPTGNAAFFSWTDLGYTTDPISSVLGPRDPRVQTDHAALHAFWQDEIAALSEVALRRHLVKLQRKKVDLAVELSQGMKTVNQMADIAKRLAGALTNLKKGRILAAFKVLFPTTPKGAANDFLAWKYGIKPLIGDLQGAAEHLAEYILRAAPLKSNGHAKHEYRRVELVNHGNGTIVGGTRSATYTERRATIRVKYGTSFSIPSTLKRQAATLGFTNPKNVAWELLPLSFVVDWFLPIGHWLESLSTFDGLIVKESYKTVFIVETQFRLSTLYGFDAAAPMEGPAVTTAGSDRGVDGFLFWEFLNLITNRKTVYCKREVITLPDIPLPKFKNPISRGHINSAVALFTQLVSK